MLRPSKPTPATAARILSAAAISLGVSAIIDTDQRSAAPNTTLQTTALPQAPQPGREPQQERELPPKPFLRWNPSGPDEDSDDENARQKQVLEEQVRELPRIDGVRQVQH